MSSESLAQVTSSGPSKVPVLSAGDLSIEVYLRWRNMCDDCFELKEIDVDDNKKRIILAMTGVQNLLMRDWYGTDRARLQALTWDAFALEFRDRWLPPNWELKARNSLVRMRQGTSDAFKDWVIKVETLNANLTGTPSHKDAMALRAHIESTMCDRLAHLAEAAEVSTIATYKAWKDKLIVLDNERIATLGEMMRLAGKLSNSRAPSSTSNPSSSASSAKRSVREYPPTLTSAERSLLSKHDGCFKCRKFYAGHRQPTCPDNPPKAQGYTELTEEDALRAKRSRDAKVKVKRENTAATRLDDELRGDHAAAVNGVLDYGTDSDFSSDNSLYVSTSAAASASSPAPSAIPSPALSSSPAIPDAAPATPITPARTHAKPLSIPHFTIRAVVHDSNGPCYNTPIRMLIDCGSSTVLVRSDVVERLALRRRPLPSPIALNSAWGSKGTTATHFVKLRISLRSLAWTSVSVRALVVDSLCSPVILGQPFLSLNNLVLDCAARTCIDKVHGFDLLNPNCTPAKPVETPVSNVRASLYERRAAMKAAARSSRSPRSPRPTCEEVIDDDFFRIRNPPLDIREDHVVERIDVEDITPLYGTIAPHDDEREWRPTIAAVRNTIERLALEERFAKEESTMRNTYADVFPAGTPKLADLPTDVYHRFKLKNPDLVISRRSYDCPKKYREAWKALLDDHLASGRMRPSSSPYASPCFLIPKADPAAAPRWVNDYRILNDNTVPDRHPLPTVDEILSDCGKGKIFGKLDMTNSFFQTRVHPDDVPYTAVTTPFGLYEWLVMPQGCRNAPATHQRRMMNALRPLIGKICHVYIDDIVIWSQSLEEHRANVAAVLDALRAHSLYASPKNTQLFALEIDFLGHHISAKGIEADPKKCEKVTQWPTPTSASDVRSFIGLVRYVDKFLPRLAEYTAVLTPLTTKDADKDWPGWNHTHQAAFDAIKKLITSRECLTVIDHNNMGENKIFVCTDASDWATGAILLYGPTRETARPVAYDSMQMAPAELNYPVHEKELLAIVRALKKWRLDLLGVPFTVYTDHQTLQNFTKQRDLSRRQARWQEFLGQYDYDTVYIPGEENTAADALSRLPPKLLDDLPTVASTSFRVANDSEWLEKVKKGYTTDVWCKRLLDNPPISVKSVNGLLYIQDRLIIPRIPEIREALFRLAHDSLGHFGFEKSYETLRAAYYWPKMRTELESMYIPSCDDCQRNKSRTTKPPGPLHPLSVPLARGDSIAIDFVGPLPKDDGFDYLMTVTCRLNSDVRLIPCTKTLSADAAADLFFRYWYCENGLPLEIISDRDKLWTSKFWTALHRLTGVKIKMSTSYHPESDGASERTNKTVIQALRYHVERNQTGWAKALPSVRFAIMNTVNSSTGIAPFQLLQGRRPRLVPPLFDTAVQDVAKEFPSEAALARDVLHQIDGDVMEAQDNLMLAKLEQARHADAHRNPDPPLEVGDEVMLSTFHRRREYLQRGDKRVAKFMVRYDGPYKITRAHPEASAYTLKLPATLKIFPTFHVSLLRPYRRADGSLFPSRIHPEPGPIVGEDGQEGWVVDRILDKRKWGRGYQYLVSFDGYGKESDTWLPAREVEDLSAFDEWLKVNDPERYARDQAKDAAEKAAAEAAAKADGKLLTPQDQPAAAQPVATLATQSVPAPSAWRDRAACLHPASGRLEREASKDPAPGVLDSEALFNSPALIVHDERLDCFKGGESVTPT